MTKRISFWRDNRGDAVVEATILFPIIMMIFAGLVLLAVYLPERAALQNATQYAATMLATEQSDTWLKYDADNAEYKWETNKANLPNVYMQLLSAIVGGPDAKSAEKIVTKIEGNRIISVGGNLEVSCTIVNYFVYKEVQVTATRTISPPVDLSFVGFPKEISISVTSTAIVQNGDEFVRSLDIAADFIDYVNKKYNLGLEKVTSSLGKVWDFLGVG